MGTETARSTCGRIRITERVCLFVKERRLILVLAWLTVHGGIYPNKSTLIEVPLLILE